MRFIAQPQPQVVFSGSWRISRRGRFAGSGWRLGAFFSPLSWSRGSLVDLGRQRRQVGVDRLFEQALLLGVEGLGLGGELQPLEHRHLVRELVDGGLLEGDLAILRSISTRWLATVPIRERTVSRSCCASMVQLGRVDHGA